MNRQRLGRLGVNAGIIATPVVIGLTVTLLAPTPAAADPLAPATGPCAGSLVGSYQINDTASVEVYYSPADGGTNCLRTVSKTSKSKRYLHVQAKVAGQSNTDEGLYRSYAGPITFTGTAGKCLTVQAKASPSTDPTAYTRRSLDSVHCG